jgi:hypothetical protein
VVLYSSRESYTGTLTDATASYEVTQVYLNNTEACGTGNYNSPSARVRSQGCPTVVEVVVLLELLKQAMAQTTIAVTATPPAIKASFERYAALSSPAGGPGGNGPGGGAGATSGVATPCWSIPPAGATGVVL